MGNTPLGNESIELHVQGGQLKTKEQGNAEQQIITQPGQSERTENPAKTYQRNGPMGVSDTAEWAAAKTTLY